MQKPSITTDTFSPDSLIAGSNVLPITRDITLLTGQNLARGAVVGRITATGKYKLSASAAGDGSEVPAGILVDDTDATAADKKTAIYEAGEFNEGKLILGAGHTITTVRPLLRDGGIHLKAIVA